MFFCPSIQVKDGNFIPNKLFIPRIVIKNYNLAMIYYEHWSKEHIMVLIIILTVMSGALFAVSKSTDKRVTVILRCLAVSHFVLEIVQDILLVREQYDPYWMLPLHLCNLGIFVNLASAFSKGKVRAIFSEISVMLIMPGALGALLFPDWNYRPLLSPVSIIIYVTHTILVLIPIIMIIRKICDIRFSHVIYPLIFMILIVPPIYLVNTKLNTNYLFLRFPVDNSPLSFVYDTFTPKYYIIPGLLILLLGVLTAEYLIAYLIRKIISLKQR